MKKFKFVKQYCKMFFFTFFVFFLSGCRNKSMTHREDTYKRVPEQIKDLVYSENDSNSYILYLKEENKYQPYIVLSGDYGGNVLVLRQYLLLDEQRVNDYSAYYENSEIDKFLNGIFFERFSEKMKKYIQETAIDILHENSVGKADISTAKIIRKVFLLSYSEIGFASNGHVGMEGEALAYFNDVSNRSALNENGRKSSWWLRTADANYRSCVYAVGPSGEIGSTNAFSQNGVRPAFCLDGDIAIEMKKAEGGEDVYVIVGE